MKENTPSSSGNQEIIHKMTDGDEGAQLGTAHAPKARQSGFPEQVNIFICSLIEMLHQILLEEEGVVGTHRAGALEELLVIVTHICLALRREELVNVHLVTQCHHDDDAWRE